MEPPHTVTSQQQALPYNSQLSDFLKLPLHYILNSLKQPLPFNSQFYTFPLVAVEQRLYLLQNIVCWNFIQHVELLP